MHAFQASAGTSAPAGHGHTSGTPHPPLPTPFYQQTSEKLLRQSSSMNTVIYIYVATRQVLGEQGLTLTRLIIF